MICRTRKAQPILLFRDSTKRKAEIELRKPHSTSAEKHSIFQNLLVGIIFFAAGLHLRHIGFRAQRDYITCKYDF
jgi:hypothetical protein